MWDRVHQHLPRTNNAAEGWPRRFRANIGGHHPNIWSFLRVLQKGEFLTGLEMEQLVAGEVAPPPRKKYRDCNARLQAVVQDYNNRGTLEYLRGIAHNFQF